jgi:hypothetical protein
MLLLYRSLLRLYPVAYRHEFGDEMLSVLTELQQNTREKSLSNKVALPIRESIGLLYGALLEHYRAATGSHPQAALFPPRRVAMRSEFRFPKTTPVLMTLILLAILMAIDKARSIEFSGPYPSPQVGPIHAADFTLVPTLLILLAAAAVAALLGWAIVFAARRSGTHRLSDMGPSQAPRQGISKP